MQWASAGINIFCAFFICFGSVPGSAAYALAPSTSFSSKAPKGFRPITEKSLYEFLRTRASQSFSPGPLIIGIGGASHADKTTFARRIQEKLKEAGIRVVIIPLDAFLQDPIIRARLAAQGNAWGPEHVRLQEMRRVLGEVRRNSWQIDTIRYERNPSVHLEPWTIPIGNAQAVIVEGLWAISSEDRLGNAWEFVDIPIYLEAGLEDVTEDLLPDFENNIHPSKVNAAFIVRFGPDRSARLYEKDFGQTLENAGWNPYEAWLGLLDSSIVPKEFFLSRKIGAGDKVLHVGPGSAQELVAAEALLGAAVTVVDWDPEVQWFHDSAPMLRRFPAIGHAGGKVAFLLADVSRLDEQIRKGALTSHSFDHISMIHVSPYWTNERLIEMYRSPPVQWSRVVDGLLVLLKEDGGTLMASGEELPKLTSELHGRGVSFRVIELGFNATGVNIPVYLLVLGENPLQRLTPFAKRKYTEFLMNEWERASGRQATLKPVLGMWLPGGSEVNARRLAEEEMMVLLKTDAESFPDSMVDNLHIIVNARSAAKRLAEQFLPNALPVADASL